MYTVELEEAEAKHIAEQAKLRGYPSVVTYLRALVAADELVAALRNDWQDADDSAEELESGFRESWHQVMTGDTLPIDQLWDEGDDA